MESEHVQKEEGKQTRTKKRRENGFFLKKKNPLALICLQNGRFLFSLFDFFSQKLYWESGALGERVYILINNNIYMTLSVFKALQFHYFLLDVPACQWYY